MTRTSSMPLKKSYSEIDLSAAILSGGLGSRMGYKDKSMLNVGGKTIIERLMHALNGLFIEIMTVSRIPVDQIYPGTRNVTDIHEARCSLTGIHSALVNSTSDHVFICSCDTPFLNRNLLTALIERLEPEFDVLVPIHEDGWIEPLCGIYSKRCIPFIHQALNNNKFQIINFFSEVVVSKVPTFELEKYDCGLESFINVNTPEELEAAQKRYGH